MRGLISGRAYYWNFMVHVHLSMLIAERDACGQGVGICQFTLTMGLKSA